MELPIQFVHDENIDMCNCRDEIVKLEKEIETKNIEHDRLNKEYHEKLIANLKKDVVIRKLKQEINKCKNQFNDFRGVLSPSSMEVIESMISTSTKDSTFVLKAMKCLYHDDLPRLKQRTYSGRSKTAVTPEKAEILKKLLIKKIDIEEKNAEKSKHRISLFAKHVKSGIENINRLQLESDKKE